MKSLLLFLSLFISVSQLYAQPDCTLTHYSSTDGLSQNTIRCMLQAQNGMMWFSTWDGLNRFDGYTFKAYKGNASDEITLANNRIEQMCEDKYGYIWLLDFSGVVHRFDPLQETFANIPLGGAQKQNISSIHTLPNGHTWLVTPNNGVIRVTTDEQTHQMTSTTYYRSKGAFPATTVHALFEDKEKNEWLLTDQGLSLVVHSSTRMQHLFQKPFHSFHEFEDEIWFGSTQGTICHYHKQTGKFEWQHLPTTSQIIYLHPLANETVLIATATDGFLLYNRKNGRHTHYTQTTCKELQSNHITSVYVDRKNGAWLDLQNEGICRLHPLTGKVSPYQIKTERSIASSSVSGFHIHEDNNGYLWVQPYGGGFSFYDWETEKLLPFHNKPQSPDSQFSDKLHSAISDRQGNLWMCTHSKGLEKATFVKEEFALLAPHDLGYETVGNSVRALYEDREHQLWVSTKDGKLHLYNKARQYIGYLTSDGTISKTGANISAAVYHILQGQTGSIWLATRGEGIVQMIPQTGGTPAYKLKQYKHEENNPHSLSCNNVYDLYEDTHGNIWVATFDEGINLLLNKDIGKNKFINHSNSLKNYPITKAQRTRCITGDSLDNIWIGTTTGLLSCKASFDRPEEITFSYYVRKPNSKNSLSNNDIFSIHPTSHQELYLATLGGGLNKVSYDSNGHVSFKAYTTKEGMPSDVLVAMHQDATGNLWIATEDALCKFYPQSENFERYNQSSSGRNLLFNEATTLYDSNEKLLFGTNRGILCFSPDSIRKSTDIPNIVFTQLLLGNKVVTSRENDWQRSGKLILQHEENNITIQFATMDFRNAANIKYAYRLKGAEEEWTYSNNQHAVNYISLPTGEHKLEVRSTNSDGIWVENTRSLLIQVRPTFWETPLAYIAYILLLILIILITTYILFTIYRLKHEVSVEQQISDLKLRFFTNISHELRTPLTLISGPVELLLRHKEQIPPSAQEQLQTVERNTNRMLYLVNQLLDFRKIQNKKMKIKAEQIDLLPFIRRIMENFESLAKEHQILFTFNAPPLPIYLWADADKLEKIIFNLLSNAFKFTPFGKSIFVRISDEDHQVSIIIQDQGIGFDESRKESIFVRFENLAEKNLFNQSNSGIGLSLVKELIDMHRASITVSSRPGQGSCFVATFQKGKEHFGKEVEFILSDALCTAPQSQTAVIPPFDAASTDTDECQESTLMTLLIVEDNTELRSFLKSIFVGQFQVIEATDGASGVAKALEMIPDIIISDIMMPIKDGMELVHELRSDMSTSHIPMILLTARTQMDSKLKALEFGADDYITKPFSSAYLEARVRNLLTQRTKLQEHYLAHQANEAPKSELPAMNPNDRKFLNKLAELMEKQMDNSDLQVDDLTREFLISRSAFFKKLKSLTGLSPIEFIKETRMKRAIELLKSSEYTIAQVSYMIGFDDPKYFSKIFKLKFGTTPSEYKKPTP